ncbi:ribosomal RNA processing protein 36 homolog isoform X2 [Ascaphus truei]
MAQRHGVCPRRWAQESPAKAPSRRASVDSIRKALATKRRLPQGRDSSNPLKEAEAPSVPEVVTRDLPTRKKNPSPETQEMAAISSGTDSSDEDTDSEELVGYLSDTLVSSGTESESHSDTEGEEQPLDTPNQRELSSMSFDELIQLQNKVGTKLYYRAARRPEGARPEGARPEVARPEVARPQGARPQGARPEGAMPSKNQPMEMSSKRPVPYLRKVVPAKKELRRDPRFDDLSGDYKPEVFEKTYRFLEDVKKNEKEVVNKKLRKVRNPELKEKLEQLIQRMDQQEESARKKQKQREREMEFKRQQRELAQQGKKPFYLKRGDLRKLELADKYQELKKRGKLEHFLSKKRKRNSTKDRKKLPNL